jgi:hypothetical protein
MDCHEMIATSNQNPDQPTAFPHALVAGAGLFLVMGIELCLQEIPHTWAMSGWVASLHSLFFIAFLLLPAVGYAVGWMRGFPAWSYPYVGLHLVSSLYMTVVATPGLQIFGYTFGSSDMWGWRAWILFLVATGIALLVTRSFQPVARFFIQAWRDWTRLSYAMYGFMPLIIMIAFDEIDRLYSLYFMILLTVLMCCTSLLFLLSPKPVMRSVSLVGGVLVTLAVIEVGSTVFWASQTPSGVNIAMMILWTLVLAGVILFPVIFPLIRLWLRWSQKPGLV